MSDPAHRIDLVVKLEAQVSGIDQDLAVDAWMIDLKNLKRHAESLGFSFEVLEEEISSDEEDDAR